MSKMNELSMEATNAAYEQMIEEDRNDLRAEGAEELRAEITRALKEQSRKADTSQEKFGIGVALVVVAQATI